MLEGAAMLSVVVPVLNESETIAEVVDFCRRSPLVGEVLVVDDGSVDGTPELAERAGAAVLTSTLLGKGASMEDGMRAARHDLILYLDGDLARLGENLIEDMARPLLEDRADFVKARFTRAAGRVTTLTAKPLLRTFFPELAAIEQPLGGIIAGRKELLRELRFENDYGVDIGLLLDAAAAGARIVEVDIGHLSHESQPLEVLGDMAMQVVRTLLDRAHRYRRLHRHQLSEVEEVERRMQAELSLLLERFDQVEKLALFDMDGTLLADRFILHLARRCGKFAELDHYLDNRSYGAEERTRSIAALFAGLPREEFEEAAREVPLSPGAAETVVALRKAGYRVGIVTDSWSVAAEIVRRRVFADFSIAHLQRFRRGKATGEVTLSPAMAHPDGCPRHDHCKANALRHLVERWGLDAGQVLAVGDGDNDICMLAAAGCSVAYRPKTFRVREAAGHVVYGPLTEVLGLLDLAGVRLLPA